MVKTDLRIHRVDHPCRRRRLLSVTVAVAALVLALPATSGAFNSNSSFCLPRARASYQISSDHLTSIAFASFNLDDSRSLFAHFDSAFKSWVVDENFVREDRSRLISSGGTTFDTSWKDLDSLVRASTGCSLFNAHMTFNTDYLVDFNRGSIDMEGVSAHEWGHAFGLKHTSAHTFHSRSGFTRSGTNTMSTCADTPAEERDRRRPNWDDISGAFHHLDGNRGGGWYTTSFPGGFETIFDSWLDESNGTGVAATRVTTPVATGLYATDLTNGSLTHQAEVTPGHGYRVKWRTSVTSRRTESGATYFYLEESATSIDFKDESAGCDHITSATGIEQNMNKATYAPYSFSTIHTCYPTTTWSECASAGGPSPLATGVNPDGWKLTWSVSNPSFSKKVTLDDAHAEYQPGAVI